MKKAVRLKVHGSLLSAGLLLCSACNFTYFDPKAMAAFSGGTSAASPPPPPGAAVDPAPVIDPSPVPDAGPAGHFSPTPEGSPTPDRSPAPEPGFPRWAQKPLPRPFSSDVPSPIASGSPRSGARGASLGESCNQRGLCLGLKYVVYDSPGQDPLQARRDAIDTVQEINLLWRECGIQFQIDDYLAVQAERERLRYRTADFGELNEIRSRFMDDWTLLVVMTGPWDRNGSLGGSHANAWTNLPGEPFLGAILELPVSRDPNVLAHELGHYLSLGHAADMHRLMNPIIYRVSSALSADECKEARWAAGYYWKNMVRLPTDR
jgi:hypothetical protein